MSARFTSPPVTPHGTTRANLDVAIAHTQPHLVPILTAVRDCGLAMMFVPQGAEAFRIPRGADRPTLTIIGDDFDAAHGPEGFHLPSVRRAIRSSLVFTVVSSAPSVEVYAAAAMAAVLGRLNALLVETRPEQELAWVGLIQKLAPGRPVLLSTVKAGHA